MATATLTPTPLSTTTTTPTPLLRNANDPRLRLRFRPLCLEDLDQLRALHASLFPLDYDDDFFVKASTGADRIYSYAAFFDGDEHSEENDDDEEEDNEEEDSDRRARRRSSPQQKPKQTLVGFVTARLVKLAECEPPDRRALGLASPAFDGEQCAYILTLGVTQQGSWRRSGVARALVRMCVDHASSITCAAVAGGASSSGGCRAAFLHVAAYNGAALALYGSLGFEPLARLPGFYTIATGRQPDPAVTSYDALLYALPLMNSHSSNANTNGAFSSLLAPFAPRGRRGEAGSGGGNGGGGRGGGAAWWWPPSWLFGGGVVAAVVRREAEATPPPPDASVATTTAGAAAATSEEQQRRGEEDDEDDDDDNGGPGEVVSSSAARQQQTQQQQQQGLPLPPLPVTPPSRARAQAPSPPDRPKSSSGNGGGGVLRWIFGARAR